MWENSVVTALAMERLARAAGEDDNEAYTLGLLRSIGKLVLDMLIEVEHAGVNCPESETLDLPKWERAWAVTTSNEAGAIILDEWKMPEQLSAALRDHYRPTAESGRMAGLLHLACCIAHQLGHGMVVETRQWDVSAEALSAAGLTQGDFDSCATETQEALEELKTRLKGN
jgi:HD-like signal output (HDOD) protein